jgi:hypothetical protein
MGNKAAECSAVLFAVEGLLQLAAQPVVRQLFGPQQLQELMGRPLSCKQQLEDTLMGFGHCLQPGVLRAARRL